MEILKYVSVYAKHFFPEKVCTNCISAWRQDNNSAHDCYIKQRVGTHIPVRMEIYSHFVEYSE